MLFPEMFALYVKGTKNPLTKRGKRSVDKETFQERLLLIEDRQQMLLPSCNSRPAVRGDLCVASSHRAA